MEQSSQISVLLQEWGKGDELALGKLMPLVYAELRRMARRYMNGQNPGNTLQPTALIHEAYLRMAGHAEKDWKNRTHFFAVAATAMRHVLVDRARAHATARRGGDALFIHLEEGLVPSTKKANELVALDDALRVLDELHPRQARVIELRFFGGLSVEETAEILHISSETVIRDWRAAKAWLSSQMQSNRRAK